MPRRRNNFVEKSKIPTMVIYEEKGIEPDSAEWHFFFFEKRFFDFQLDLDRKPNLVNPLDTWGWDNLPEFYHEYDDKTEKIINRE